MSSIRDRLGLSGSSNSDIRNRLGLTNVTPETPKNTAPKFASRNEKTGSSASRYKSAAEQLQESRKKYQDYLKEETKDTSSLKVSPLSSQSFTDLRARTPEMIDVAQTRARDLDKAVKSQKGQELKQDVKQKQSEFNYANYLKNVEEVENTKPNIFQKLTNPIISGVADFLQTDRLNPESQYYYDDEGNKTYLPTKRALTQQKIKEESSGVGKIYNDVIYNMSKAAASKAIDLAVPGAGTMLYYGDVMLDSTEEAKKQGFTGTQAVAYGAVVTILANQIDKVVGTMGGLSKPGTEQTLSKGADKLLFKLTKNKAVSNILSNMGSEAISEFAEEYADNIAKYAINADASDYDSFVNMLSETLPDAAYAGLVGGISGGVGGTIESLTNTAEMTERKQALEDYRDTLENYKPQSPLEAQFKEDELVKVEQALQSIEVGEQEIQQPEQQEVKTEQKKIEKSEVKTKEPKKNNVKLDIDNGEKIIKNITSDTKQQKTLTDVFSEPTKNKKTVAIDKNTKIITPSEQIRNDENANIKDVVDNTVSTNEHKQIESINKSRRKSFENMLKKYTAEDNKDRAEYIKNELENNLYEVKNTKYEVFNEELNMLEDPEHYYNDFKKEFDEAMKKGELTNKQTDNFQNKIMAMERYYGAYGAASYNPTIANELSTMFGELGTNPAQTLAARKQFYDSNPQFLVHKVTNVLRSIYNEQLKKHEGDIAWKEANNPLNSNSPYHLTNKQYGIIDKVGNQLAAMKDKTSLEYLQKENALNNYIQDIYKNSELGNKLADVTNKIRSITVSNVLASTRIWTQNIKGNFVNLAQFKVLDNLPAIYADTKISSKTGIRTKGISFEGDVVTGAKAFKKGIYDSWYEFKYDVTLSKFASKYTTRKEGSLGDKGFGKTFDDSTKVGHAFNRYQDFVNFALTMGDRPYANMYYEQSIYNQRMTNAMLQAQKKGTNVIYKETQNLETDTHAVSYYDKNGDIHSGEIMTKKQYNKFMEDALVQDITSDMCAIAEKEALENTYQNDNTITKAALKMKDALNDIFHIGEYGFGDMLLKFTRTGSNMAKALYEHSPLEAIALYKDVKALNANIKNGTVTPELQHRVASDFGKLVGGAMTTFIMAALNWSGITNIEDDEDKDKAKSFKESTTGSRSYSIKLPGLNYNYKITSDSTIGSLMKLGVDMEKMYERTGSVIDTFLKTSTPFINEIIDNTFMESILGLGSSYSTPLDNIARKIAAQPSNLLPSWFKDFSYMLDGFTDRNAYDADVGQYMINQIINKTPFRGNENIGLPSRKTAWGETKKIGGDMLAAAWNTFLLGESLAKVNDDEIAQEVIEVYTATGKTDAIPTLTKPNKSFNYNGKTIELSEKDRDKYQSTYGKTAYSALKDLMKTSQYKNGDYTYRYNLIKKAYDYAIEKAKQQAIESQGKKFYNYHTVDGEYTEYKKTVFEEIVENDISIKEAQYKRQYENAYKLKTSVTNWENYNNIADDIKAIKTMYSDYKTSNYAVKTYISRLQGLTPTQKAMLSKLENNKGDYNSYDNAILNYLKTLHLSEEEFEYMYDKLGLGGYWKQYYYNKK